MQCESGISIARTSTCAYMRMSTKNTYVIHSMDIVCTVYTVCALAFAKPIQVHERHCIHEDVCMSTCMYMGVCMSTQA